MRSAVVRFQDEIAHAKKFADVAEVAQTLRRFSLANNFFLPPKDVAFYERLLAVKALADEGLLEDVEWWRAKSLKDI